MALPIDYVQKQEPVGTSEWEKTGGPTYDR